MGKRGFNRVSEKLPVDYYWDGELYEGVVTNLSGNGMYIEAGTCPGKGSNIEIVLIVGDEAFKLFAMVRRTERADGSGGGMGVELLDPSLHYRRFICIVHDYLYNRPSAKAPGRVREKVAG